MFPDERTIFGTASTTGEHPLITIDRPMGSTHPRYPGSRYPVDYGFLAGTTSMDAGGVDIWVGSLGEKRVVGALCTVDLLKRDTELKIMIDCSLGLVPS